MTSLARILPIGAALLLGGCATTGPSTPPPLAMATLALADGSAAGSATIIRRGDGLLLTLSVERLSAGEHGAHIHAVGNCGASGFTSAGGHLNPRGHMHGTLNPGGSHLGDLPNIAVSAAGTGRIEFQLPGLAAEIESEIFDADGAAIVVHASADDYRTDPAGNSGARIACGVLRRAP